jgi:hypothetical protein
MKPLKDLMDRLGLEEDSQRSEFVWYFENHPLFHRMVLLMLQ